MGNFGASVLASSAPESVARDHVQNETSPALELGPGLAGFMPSITNPSIVRVTLVPGGLGIVDSGNGIFSADVLLQWHGDVPATRFSNFPLRAVEPHLSTVQDPADGTLPASPDAALAA